MSATPRHHHPLFVRALGLSPLIALSDTAIKGVAVAVVLGLTLVATAALGALLRRWTVRELRLVQHLIIAASVVSCIDLLLQAWLYALHAALGPYVAVLAVNALVFDGAQGPAARAGVRQATAAALACAGRVLVTTAVLAVGRELIGHGRVFGDGYLLSGALAAPVPAAGLMLVTLPAGGLIAFGLLAAARNMFDATHRAGTPGR